MQFLKRLSFGIDKMNYWIGRVCSFLMMPLIVITTGEVAARYILKHPTIWSWEINMQIWCFLVMMCGAYCYLNHNHVSVDVVYKAFPERVRKVLDMITALLIITVMSIIIYYGTDLAIFSLLRDERQSTAFASPMWTIRWSIPIGCFLMLLQGISELIKTAFSMAGTELPSVLPKKENLEDEYIEQMADEAKTAACDLGMKEEDLPPALEKALSERDKEGTSA